MSQIYTELAFPALITLEYTKIYHKRELEWIQWHLLNCKSLVNLHLAFTAPFSRFDIVNIFSGVRLHNIQVLRLELVDLSIINTPILSYLHTLEIKSCPATKTFLCRLIQLKQATCLKSLRIVRDILLTTVNEFIFMLNPIELADLYLNIGNTLEYLNINTLKAFQRLRTLVLDFRERIKDPRSVIKYEINDLQNILAFFHI